MTMKRVGIWHPRSLRSRINYVTTYKRSRVLSVRIAAEELDALAEQAATEGRSVSGQVAFFVREKVATWQSPKRKPQKISGWLSHLHVPESHREFQAARSTASAKLLESARSKAKRPTTK
jgi:hypothetical protein